MREHIGAAEIVAALGVGMVGVGVAGEFSIWLALIVVGLALIALAVWRL